MSYIILSLMVVAAAVVIGKAALGPNGGSIMPTVQLAGGIVLSLLALVLALAGPRSLFYAIPIGAIGAALILNRQRSTVPPLSAPGGGGRYSDVRTQWIDMVLDHNSGAMTGTVLSGAFSGRTLESLSEDEALSLHAEVSGDPQSVQLLEAFLDRTFENWRSRAHETSGGASSGPMTREKALEILGLADGASDDDIRAAHRELMKKVHPDQGGSTFLATQINAAKDFLLGD